MRRRNRTASFLILLSCRYALDSKLRSNLREIKREERERENNFRDTVGGGPVLLLRARARALGNELSTRPFAVLRCRKTRLCLCTHTHCHGEICRSLIRENVASLSSEISFEAELVIPMRLINFIFTHLSVYIYAYPYLFAHPDECAVIYIYKYKFVLYRALLIT